MVLQRGRGHPLIEAVCPSGEAPPERVIDATLGLAKDALHVATVLGCPVTGLERVRLLCCLAEDGLAQLAREDRPWSAGARRVEVVEADAAVWLAAQPTASADVVFLDPMFPRPRPAAAGFELLRAVAWPAPLSPALLREATRVARRVVLKVPAGDPADAHSPDARAWTRRVSGTQLDYLVAERGGGPSR